MTPMHLLKVLHNYAYHSRDSGDFYGDENFTVLLVTQPEGINLQQ